MATQTTIYLASDGKSFTDNETAESYQEALNNTNGKLLSEEAFDIFFANANGDKELWEVNGEHIAALINMPSEYVSKINEVLQRTHDNTLQRTSR